MSDQFTITASSVDDDDFSILQLSSSKQAVSFTYKDGVLGDSDCATDGDRQAQAAYHWERIINILHGLAGRKDIQAMFAERGLKIERKTL